MASDDCISIYNILYYLYYFRYLLLRIHITILYRTIIIISIKYNMINLNLSWIIQSIIYYYDVTIETIPKSHILIQYSVKI